MKTGCREATQQLFDIGLVIFTPYTCDGLEDVYFVVKGIPEWATLLDI